MSSKDKTQKEKRDASIDVENQTSMGHGAKIAPLEASVTRQETTNACRRFATPIVYAVVLAFLVVAIAISVWKVTENGVVMQASCDNTECCGCGDDGHDHICGVDPFMTDQELLAAVSSYLKEDGIACVPSPEYPIGEWDVSQVQDFSGIFSKENHGQAAKVFNQDISGWHTSAATTMEKMFYGARKFNSPIGEWDVSSVTNMENMFGKAESFNQAIGEWNTSAVTSMRSMFSSALYFNQPVGSWDVSSVVDMSHMFFAAASFNRPIGEWVLSSVEDMSGMFRFALFFDNDISTWDVSSVTNTSAMFVNAYSFNQPLASWDVSAVEDIGSMFSNAASFNQDLCTWQDKLVSLIPDVTLSNLGQGTFYGTSCPSWSDPGFVAHEILGPFCHECED